MPAIILLFSLLLQSCSHYIFDSETRLQIENNTESTIHSLSIVSQNGQTRPIVPDTLQAGDKSKVRELQLVGKFDFIIYSDETPSSIHLGCHKLKGGSVYAHIIKDTIGGGLKIEFK